MKKLSLIIALMTFMATAWAQNSTNVGSESELRSKLSNSQYDGYTINLTSTITVHSQLEVSHINTINMNGKSIVAESAATRIFHVVSQGSLPYMPSLTLTGNGTLNGGGNGGTLDGGAIYNEGMLTLQNVTLQNCSATHGGAVYNTGTMTMSGGSITGCTASTHGGAIYNKGTLTVDGGTLSSNTGNDAGAIYNESGKTLTINGGTFSNNTATTYSGGAVVNEGTASVNGGTFSGNTAQVNGGAIYNYGTLTMTGGNVNSNTAPAGTDGNGGGVYIHKNGGNFNMSGNPQIYGNSSNNLYLGTGKTITVNGAFTEGANIHVTHADGLDGNGYRDIATGYTTYNASTDPATVFRSDNAAYEVGLHTGTTAASLIAATHLYDVPYLNVDETGSHGMATRATCIMMSSFALNSPVTLYDEYWYVVDQDLTFSERISIASDCTVNLILMDNTTLTANKGVFVSAGTALHIWGQSTRPLSDPNPMGQLNAYANTTNYSGLGGRRIADGTAATSDAGGLAIHGGFISATGGRYASGIHTTPVIGAGQYSLRIYGGQVLAVGGDNGAGIGGCFATICGGIQITGGTVTGIGGVDAAGIGSGRYGKMHTMGSGFSGNPAGSDVTVIRITGGYVTGWGNTGAGIGGGVGNDNEGGDTYDGDPAVVYIDGGTVYAYTTDPSPIPTSGRGGAVAIGWGYYGMDGYNYVHIYDNAKVTASTTINSADETLQTAANGRGDNCGRFKRMLIEPCDHPEGNHYTDNGSSLYVCDYCYTKEPYTFQTAGNWNDASHWLSGFRPDNDNKTGNNVAVKAAATIPNGCTANVGNIDMQDGGSLTIADGGQLLHTNAGVQATVQKSITGHGGNNNGGWYFIASPTVDSLAPTNVANMTTSSYDLYYYHEPTSKWRNYKPAQGNADPGFKIAPQQGYLYAKENTTTLNMTGTLRPSNTAVTINGLSHSSSTLTGFNLVGNPFACNATVSGSCYTIQTVNGKQVIEAAIAPTVGPCEGVMVQVDAVNDSVTFTKVTPATQSNQPNHGSLQITLSQVPEPVVAERGRSVEGSARNQVGVSTGSTTLALDNAIITFNEGNQLGKFYLGEQNANIYIPQDGEAYAIACVSDSRDGMYTVSTNEMPLNFKAKADGTYTITVNPEGVEMGYLHLIDNMTGADVDLLAAGPSTGSGASYTFTAKTTDYESRFKLVFSANGEDGPSTGSGAFAYVNNGEIIITGVVGDACNASLQVIDVTGRIVRCRDALSVVETH